MRRATGRRDQAIILTLLNAGLRASELSALKVGDVNLKSSKVLVKHRRLSGAKGGRVAPFTLGKPPGVPCGVNWRRVRTAKNQRRRCF